MLSGSASVAAGQVESADPGGVRRGGPVRARCSKAGEGEKGVQNREKTRIEGGVRCSNSSFSLVGVSPRACGTGGARRVEMLPFP